MYIIHDKDENYKKVKGLEEVNRPTQIHKRHD